MAVLERKSPIPWLKPAVLTGSLVPIVAILERAWRDDLGPDPIAQALNQLGLIALVFLIAALGCTPLKAATAAETAAHKSLEITHTAAARGGQLFRIGNDFPRFILDNYWGTYSDRTGPF